MLQSLDAHTMAALFITILARKLNRFLHIFSQTHYKNIYLQSKNKVKNPPTPSWLKLKETVISTAGSTSYPLKNT